MYPLVWSKVADLLQTVMSLSPPGHLCTVYREQEDSELELTGIITLEDVIEELIGEEIIDETDLYVDVHRRIAVARARLQYHRQSISEPNQLLSSARRLRRRPQRSISQPHIRHGEAMDIQVEAQLEVGDRPR